MAGLVPAITLLAVSPVKMDSRDKPSHDEWGVKWLETKGVYPISAFHSSSESTFTPSSAAFFALEPASAPTIR